MGYTCKLRVLPVLDSADRLPLEIKGAFSVRYGESRLGATFEAAVDLFVGLAGFQVLIGTKV